METPEQNVEWPVEEDGPEVDPGLADDDLVEHDPANTDTMEPPDAA